MYTFPMPLERPNENTHDDDGIDSVEAGNAAAANGTLGSTMPKILGEMKPETAYFAATNGERTGYIFFDMTDSSQLPAIAEPFLLAFNARIDVKPAMNPQDLAAAGAGIARAAKSYAPKA